MRNRTKYKGLPSNRYNYSREDESIYNIFLEISNSLLPDIVKNFSTGIVASRDSLLCDPECYAYILLVSIYIPSFLSRIHYYQILKKLFIIQYDFFIVVL